MGDRQLLLVLVTANLAKHARSRAKELFSAYLLLSTLKRTDVTGNCSVKLIQSTTSMTSLQNDICNEVHGKKRYFYTCRVIPRNRPIVNESQL